MSSLPTRTLGSTNLEVTFPALGGVGLGSEFYGGVDETTGVETVLTAVSRGINFIDTAPLYQHSEHRVGLALSELDSSVKDSLIIASKVADECAPFSNNGGHDALSAAGVRCSIENSLRVMGIEHMHVCLIHDLTPAELEDFLADGGGMDGLREAKAEGLIGHIGLGTHDKPHAPLHRRFLEDPDAEVLLTVNDYNILRRYAGGSSGALPAAQVKNAGVMNAGVFYMGLLSGIDPRESYSMGFKGDLTKEMARTIDIATRQWEWCNERGVSLGALALQWAMKHEAVSTCIIGCRTPEEVNGVCDNAAAVVGDEIWSEFASEFDDEIASLTEDDHWWCLLRRQTSLDH